VSRALTFENLCIMPTALICVFQITLRMNVYIIGIAITSRFLRYGLFTVKKGVNFVYYVDGFDA
jgi:hypothetical protein